MTEGKPADPTPNDSGASTPPEVRLKPLRVYAAAAVVVAALAALAFSNAAGLIRLVDVAPAFSPSAPSSNSGSFAFAKASPLLIFDNPSLMNGRKQDFEFGKPYEVSEQSSEFVRIKLADGTQTYVRSAHVTTLRSPRFLTTNSGYQKSERARIRLWESTVKLNEFLSGTNTAGAPWDYEEYFDSAPDFQLKLPIVETDTLDLLGGNRQIDVVSVLLPISKEMYQAFEEVKSGPGQQIDIHFLLDISLSTKQFLERTFEGIGKSLARNDDLRKRIVDIDITTFGESRRNRSAFLGKVSLDSLPSLSLHPQSQNIEPATGEREPIVDGLVSMVAESKSGSALPLLIVLSGADVEISSKAQAKTTAIEDVNLPSSTSAIFAQITPEPSDELKNVGSRLRNITQLRYLDYSESLAEDVVSDLRRTVERMKTTSFEPIQFSSVAKVASERHMMAFLPRVLSPTSSLPARQAYAAQSDWCSIRLWLTLDGLLWNKIER